jgi:hypothetical protein
MNLAKSLIVSEKNFFNHRAPLCSEMALFGQKSVQILPSGKPD